MGVGGEIDREFRNSRFRNSRLTVDSAFRICMGIGRILEGNYPFNYIPVQLRQYVARIARSPTRTHT